MPYDLSELEGAPEGAPNPVMMYVSMDSMTSPESLRSLEGVPIVAWDHAWITLEGVKVVSKGNVAGAPLVVGPFLEIDLLVTDAQTIQDIKDRKIGEVSAAYNAQSIFESGEHDGERYDARQTQIRYNHIAIIPEGRGRAGFDVRILNEKSKEGDESMATVKVKLRNGKYINTDEDGAAVVADDTTATETKEVGSGKQLEDLMAQCEDLKAAKAESDAQLEEVRGELSVYKEKLDQLLSEETIEAAAGEMNAEQGEASEILENSTLVDDKGKEVTEDAEKDKIKNSIKALHGQKLHSAVLSSIGVKCENMSPEALRGAFHAQHQVLNTLGGAGRKVVAGTKLMNSTVAKDGQVITTTQRSGHDRLGIKKAV
jgi:hypothetical protein